MEHYDTIKIQLEKINQFILALTVKDLKNYENLEELYILSKNLTDMFELIKYPNYYKRKLNEINGRLKGGINDGKKSES